MHRYETTGEGEPIVVIGDPGHTTDFGLLNDWFQLFAPAWPDADRAGTAEADPAADPLTALITFIEHLDLWPVHLIGWGAGTQTALRLAMERPDLVRRLAVLGPLPAHDVDLPCRTRLAALATMTVPLLVLQGDDEALDVAHSAALTRTVPDGRLAVLPVPSRLLPTAQPDLVGLLLLDFFGAEQAAEVARTA